jgi:hypothetical protein
VLKVASPRSSSAFSAWARCVHLSKASQAELDRTKKGIAQIRSGAFQAFSGVITTLPTNGLTDDWRRDRLAVFAVIAPGPQNSATGGPASAERYRQDDRRADDGSRGQVRPYADRCRPDGALSAGAALGQRGISRARHARPKTFFIQKASARAPGLPHSHFYRSDYRATPPTPAPHRATPVLLSPNAPSLSTP